LQGYKVKDLLNADGGWNWSLLQDWLPMDIQDKIAAIFPPNLENGRDKRCSVGGNSNGFSINATYQNLCGLRKEEAEPKWSKVWKLSVPERVKTFMWLVLHNRILTNELKSRMGLGHSMCTHCVNIEETVIHVLRDCPIAMEFWNNAIPTINRGSFYMREAQQWIEDNLGNTIERDNSTAWCNFWALACYSLWIWRNKEQHDENFIRPAIAVPLVWKKVDEYNAAMRNSEDIMEKDKVVRLIRWKQPKSSFVSLNTDGASKEHQLAGCGGIVRGSQGEWLGGFSKSIGRCSAFIAELWGVLEGLHYVKRLGFTKIELNIDSEAVVRVVRTGRSQSAAGSVLVEQISKMMALDWEVEVRHTYREANKCADALANYGCMSRDDSQLFTCCPDFIKNLFDADNLGISTPRLILM
jgi:ribonuclease HI